MAKLVTVSLFGHAGTGIILKCPSGIAWGNQSGGIYCLQPSCEGIFVPWFNDVELKSHRLLSMENLLWERNWGRGGFSGELTAKEADVLDEIMRQTPSFKGVRVDRTQLAESWEAWVHVTIDPDQTSIKESVTDLDPFPRHGVLVWGNSD